MNYFKCIIFFILLNPSVVFPYTNGKADSINKRFVSTCLNNSVHRFKTPQGYKSENLFSSGYSFDLGLENKLFAVSIGYRNHNFVFRQHNTALDSFNGLGTSAKYYYKIESIPIRLRYEFIHKEKSSLALDLGISLNRENFTKVITEYPPNVTNSYYLVKYDKAFSSLNGSFGIDYEYDLNKKFSVGCSVEAQVEFTKSYTYGVPSQMSSAGKFLYPFGWTPIYVLNSIYLKYSFNVK